MKSIPYSTFGIQHLNAIDSKIDNQFSDEVQFTTSEELEFPLGESIGIIQESIFNQTHWLKIRERNLLTTPRQGV
jgi:hypothetical protein